MIEDAHIGGEPAVLRSGSPALARLDRPGARARRRHTARSGDSGAGGDRARLSPGHCRESCGRRRDGERRPARTADSDGNGVRDHREVSRPREGAPDPAAAARDAQMLLAHIADAANHFNRTTLVKQVRDRGDRGVRKLHESGRRSARSVDRRDRTPSSACARPSSGRATLPTEGTDAIRALFEQQSSYLRVSFFQQLQEMPRPFSVVFKDEG